MKQYFRAIPILGFAHSRSDVIKHLEQNVIEIFQHLVKLWRYPDALEVPHWRTEIYNFLHKVHTFKSNNKRPSAEFIFQNTFGRDEQYIDTAIKQVSKRYDRNYKCIQEDTELLHRRIQMYFEWLSEELSSTGVALPEDIYEKLEELGFGNDKSRRIY